MLFQFQFSKEAEKSFIKLPKLIQKQIIKKLDFYEDSDNPLFFAKKLQKTANEYRLRIGNYRVIFRKDLKGNLVVLLILKVGHRKEIYK